MSQSASNTPVGRGRPLKTVTIATSSFTPVTTSLSPQVLPVATTVSTGSTLASTSNSAAAVATTVSSTNSTLASSASAAAVTSLATPLHAPAQSTVAAVSLKLPPFWPTDPELWFVQVEAQFSIRGITDERTKYSYVVSSLGHEFAHEVRDVLIHPPAQHPYTHLKQQLVLRLCSSEQKRIRQLLTEEQLGDRKPSQFLRHLQQLQGNTQVESAVLQELFLQRLPSHVRMVLASTTDLSLERQALLADNLVEISQASTISHLRTSDTDHAVPDTIAELRELRAEINAIRKDLATSSSSGSSGTFRRQRSRSQSPFRRTSRSRSPSADSSTCWYHRRFGDQARRCTLPCDMSGKGLASQ